MLHGQKFHSHDLELMQRSMLTHFFLYLRMIKGIDVERLTLRKADGWAMGDMYEA